jgi:hypothetical protein
MAYRKDVDKLSLSIQDNLGKMETIIAEQDDRIAQLEAELGRKIREVNNFAEKWAMANGDIAALKIELQQAQDEVAELTKVCATLVTQRNSLYTLQLMKGKQHGS